MGYEYLIIFLTLFVVVLIVIILYFASYFIVSRNSDKEKNSLYECGFEPFESVRNMFDIQFYLIAILFVIFDLEFILFFPFITSFYTVDFFGMAILFSFLWLLILGYLYEYILGTLYWH